MPGELEGGERPPDSALSELRLTRRAVIAAGIAYGGAFVSSSSAKSGATADAARRRRRHLPVRHTGSSTWVIVDTRGLSRHPGARLRIDGKDATTAFGYPQPTARNPVVRLLMPVGRHRFAFGPYRAVLDVYWRGYPFTGRTDIYAELNTKYFGGARPGGVDNKAAFQNSAALNNGYSVVPDPAPATSCVFAVAPGDQPFIPGKTTTRDTRAELNMTDDYALFGQAIPGSPPGGLDVFGNASSTVRFWRLDYVFPSSWAAPVPVQNTQGGWAEPPYGSGRGRWQLPPAARGGPRPSRFITNSVAVIKFLNNILETGGPGIIVWSMSYAGEDLCWIYSPSALGRQLGNLRIDVHPLRFDHRENTILEYRPHPYCTNGAGARFYSYGVPPGGPPYGGGYLRTWRRIGRVWRCTSAGNPYAVPGTPKIVRGQIVGDRVHGRDAGKIFGPTIRTHPDGSIVEGLVASPGLNAQQSLPSPLCVREWPLLIGPTFASVSGPPPI